MTKRWVDVVGDFYVERFDPDAPPGGDVPLKYVKSNGEIEGIADLPADGGAFLTWRGERMRTLSGSASVLAAINNCVVHDVQLSAEVRVMLLPSAVGFDNKVHDYTLPPGAVALRCLFDVPGDEVRAPAVYNIAAQAPLPYVHNGGWEGVAAGWFWSGSDLSYPRRLEGRPNYVRITDAGQEAGPFYDVRGTMLQSAYLADGLPLGLIRHSLDQIDSDVFGGGVAEVQGMDRSGAAAIARFTQLRYLISEKPTWQARVDTTLLTIGDDSRKLFFAAFYPDGKEAVAGLRVKIASRDRRVSYLRADGVWANSIVVTTDSAGKAEIRIRPDSEGADQLTIEDGGNTRYMRFLFDPPLSAGQNVTITKAGAPSPPTIPPPDPGGGAPPVCTIVPAEPEVPSKPATLVRESTLAWDAGAVSIASHSGDVQLLFTADSKALGAAIGFTAERVSNVDPVRINAGFAFGQNRSGHPTWQVIEAGIRKGEPHAFTLGDEFRIAQVGNTVRYFVGAAQLHTSQAVTPGSVSVGAALYAAEDALPGPADGTCFWTGFVNAAEDCTDAPPEMPVAAIFDKDSNGGRYLTWLGAAHSVPAYSRPADTEVDLLPLLVGLSPIVMHGAYGAEPQEANVVFGTTFHSTATLYGAGTSTLPGRYQASTPGLIDALTIDFPYMATAYSDKYGAPIQGIAWVDFAASSTANELKYTVPYSETPTFSTVSSARRATAEARVFSGVLESFQFGGPWDSSITYTFNVAKLALLMPPSPQRYMRVSDMEYFSGHAPTDFSGGLPAKGTGTPVSGLDTWLCYTWSDYTAQYGGYPGMRDADGLFCLRSNLASDGVTTPQFGCLTVGDAFLTDVSGVETYVGRVVVLGSGGP